MDKDKAARGIVLLDKPAGITSLQCTDKAKSIFRAEKVGHAGTLDPNASGVFLIALNESRKAIPLFMGLDKEYEGIMHLHSGAGSRQIEKSFKKFTGEILQTPPKKSAVSRKPRKRKIYSLKIMKIIKRDVHFKVKCESGTYIRKLVHDIGEMFGCGAHMTKLRRTGIDGFSLRDCASLEELEKNPKTISLEKALERIKTKKILIRKSSLKKILNGAPVRLDDAKGIDKRIAKGERIGVFHGEKIIAIAVAKTDFKNINKKGSIARTDRIFRI